MKRAKKVSALLVLLLAVIALAVSVWQMVLADFSKAGCWLLIVVYWLVLTVKNVVDLF